MLTTILVDHLQGKNHEIHIVSMKAVSKVLQTKLSLRVCVCKLFDNVVTTGLPTVCILRKLLVVQEKKTLEY